MMFRRIVSAISIPGMAYLLYRAAAVLWVHDPLPLVVVVPAIVLCMIEALERAVTGKRWSE